jgi:L-alanine-DL-glutamate epimerase-like enolase superfamily enzyme
MGPSNGAAAADGRASMSRAEAQIVRISTLHIGRIPNVVFVEIETADGLVGLGETLFGAAAVSAYIHETAAPFLLGEDARDIPRLWGALYRYWGRSGIGAETRGASAIDIALWDLAGKRAGQPLVQTLGGAARWDIGAYNTCGGPQYTRKRGVPGDKLFGDAVPGGQFEDLWAFEHEPVALARSLLDMGFRQMKIWPFDVIADETGGNWISPRDMERGLEPFRLIRDAVGDDMEVALELHGRWNLPSAIRIAQAIEPYQPMWIEDPIRMDSIDVLGEFVRSTSIPTVASENLGSPFPYRDLLERAGVGIIMTDPSWDGGITVARRVADLAALYLRPFTPHDCSGPVTLAVGVHLCLNAENALVQEMVRAYYFGWYDEVVTGLPVFESGRLRASDGFGHGIDIRAEVRDRDDVVTQTSVWEP